MRLRQINADLSANSFGGLCGKSVGYGFDGEDSVD